MELMFTIAGGILLAGLIPPFIALCVWLVCLGIAFAIRMWPVTLLFVGLIAANMGAFG